MDIPPAVFGATAGGNHQIDIFPDFSAILMIHYSQKRFPLGLFSLLGHAPERESRWETLGKGGGTHLVTVIGYSGLFSLAAISLVGGQLVANPDLFGFSGTAWITVGAIGFSVLTLAGVYAGDKPEITRRDPPNSVYRWLWGVSVLLIVYVAVQWILNPSWDGTQSLLSLLAFVLVLFTSSRSVDAFTDHRRDILLWVLIMGTNLGLVVAAFYPGFHGWSIVSRDRGEVLVLATVITAIAVKSKLLIVASSVFFSLSVVLTDSRFSVAVQALVIVLLARGLLSKWGRARSTLAATLVGVGYGFAAHTLQGWLGLRRSFQLPQGVTALFQGVGPESESSAPALLPTEAQVPGSPAYEFQEWSNGRTEVWNGLLKSINTTWEVIFGLGPGRSAVEGAAINPAFTHPHNEYLRFLVDTGVIGLVLLISVLVLIGLSILRQCAQLSAMQFWGGLALLASLVIQSFMSNPLLTVYGFLPTAFFLGTLFRQPKLEASSK